MNPETFEQLRWAAIQFGILLIAISLHEYGHAKVADMRGDPLPRAQGRVTLNPVAHWDMIGTIAIPSLMIFLPILTGSSMPIALIGWGKPVQISLPNPKTRKWDDILTTLAGPGMNLVQALIYALALGLVVALWRTPDESSLQLFWSVHIFLKLGIMLNCMLVAFNMLPIPPLDGSRVARYLFGIGDELYMVMSRYSIIVLLLLVNISPGGTSLLSRLIEPATIWISEPFILIAKSLAAVIS